MQVYMELQVTRQLPSQQIAADWTRSIASRVRLSQFKTNQSLRCNAGGFHVSCQQAAIRVSGALRPSKPADVAVLPRHRQQPDGLQHCRSCGGVLQGRQGAARLQFFDGLSQVHTTIVHVDGVRKISVSCASADQGHKRRHVPGSPQRPRR